MTPPRRPFSLSLKPNEVVMISECEGAFVVEPMRFLWPSQAKAQWHQQHRRAA